MRVTLDACIQHYLLLLLYLLIYNFIFFCFLEEQHSGAHTQEDDVHVYYSGKKV